MTIVGGSPGARRRTTGAGSSHPAFSMVCQGGFCPACSLVVGWVTRSGR